MRLELVPSDFPSSWPPPHAGTLEVERAGSALVLPVLGGAPVAPPPVFAPGEPEASRPERVRRDDPGHCTASAIAELELDWPEASVRSESRTTLRSDPESWHLTIELDAFEGDDQIAERRWERRVPRDLQ